MWLFLCNKMNVLKATSNFISKAFTSLISPSTYRGDGGYSSTNMATFEGYGADATGHFFSWQNNTSSLIAYEKCAPLQAIVNRRGMALISGERKFKNSLGKPSNSITAKKVEKLFNNPNFLETGAQFFTRLSIYVDLASYAIILPIKPVGFGLEDAESLWIVPPSICQLIPSPGGFNFTNGGIDGVMIGGVRLKMEDVLFISAFNPSISSFGIPQSILRPLADNLNNIIGAFQSESNLIKQRGPQTLITNSINPAIGAPLPWKGAKEEVQASFNKSYGLLNSQSSIIITDAVMNVQRIGFDAKQLGLEESIVRNVKVVADAIGFPVNLLGIVDSKYDNLETAERALYTKFTMPSAKNIAEQLSHYFLKTDTFYWDYSHIPELQANRLEYSKALEGINKGFEIAWKNGIITRNMWLKAIDQDMIEGGDGEMYYPDWVDKYPSMLPTKVFNGKNK